MVAKYIAAIALWVSCLWYSGAQATQEYHTLLERHFPQLKSEPESLDNMLLLAERYYDEAADEQHYYKDRDYGKRNALRWYNALRKVFGQPLAATWDDIDSKWFHEAYEENLLNLLNIPGYKCTYYAHAKVDLDSSRKQVKALENVMGRFDADCKRTHEEKLFKQAYDDYEKQTMPRLKLSSLKCDLRALLNAIRKSEIKNEEITAKYALDLAAYDESLKNRAWYQLLTPEAPTLELIGVDLNKRRALHRYNYILKLMGQPPVNDFEHIDESLIESDDLDYDQWIKGLKATEDSARDQFKKFLKEEITTKAF